MSKTAYDYDVIVIGAGPAGYVAATRAAQLGLKTACIDRKGPKGAPCLGGDYINAGCIAAIALLESAKLVHLLQHGIHTHGISTQGIQVDMDTLQQRKNSIVSTLNAQIGTMFATHQVTSIHADAQIINPTRVEITPINDGLPQVITAAKIILAAGSSAVRLNFIDLDHDYIIDTSRALNLTTIPKTMGIIGAGAIGVELACIWNKLGTKVVLLEAQEDFMAIADQEIAAEALNIYQADGLDIRLGARVIGAQVDHDKQQVVVDYQYQQQKQSCRFDKLVVASGRKPNTEALIAPSVDLLLDTHGFVHVDEHCCTTLPGVYAIGDLTLSGPMLAHKGIEEGIFVAEHIAGQYAPINYHTIPNVIYTEPEITWVGQTEQELLALDEPIKTSVFPFSATSRAQVAGTTQGLVKMIMHAESERILGVHIIGTGAADMIAEAVLAIEFSATAEDLARTIHARPTISEALHETALALTARSLHIN